jgi:hypothetical protein
LRIFTSGRSPEKKSNRRVVSRSLATSPKPIDGSPGTVVMAGLATPSIVRMTVGWAGSLVAIVTFWWKVFQSLVSKVISSGSDSPGLMVISLPSFFSVKRAAVVQEQSVFAPRSSSGPSPLFLMVQV